MNLKLIALPAALAGLTLVAFTGCNKQNDLAQSTTPAYEPARVSDLPMSGAPMTDAPFTSAEWNQLRGASYEAKADFDRQLKAMNSTLEARVSELRSEYNEAQASASRKAAMDELKNSEADFKQKMSAVGRATKDTWNSAKSDAAASWDRLQAAYDRARAEK